MRKCWEGGTPKEVVLRYGGLRCAAGRTASPFRKVYPAVVARIRTHAQILLRCPLVRIIKYEELARLYAGDAAGRERRFRMRY